MWRAQQPYPVGGVLDLPYHSLRVSLERAGDHDKANELEVALQGFPLELPGLWMDMGVLSCPILLLFPKLQQSAGWVGRSEAVISSLVAQGLDSRWVVPVPDSASTRWCGHGTP